MPAEVLDGIATMAAFAKQNNCTDARATIFVTDLGISSLNTLPRTSTTWNGFTFYHYQVYFTNMWTTWQTVAEAGQTTQAVLTAIKDLAVNAGGMASGPIGVVSNLYSLGATCLNAWTTATGKTPIYGNTSNKVMVDVSYDMYLKYTYYYEL